MGTFFDHEARVTRALREVIADYTFTSHDGSLICESPSGHAYIVDAVTGTCSCPDALTRCTEPGQLCKHAIAARLLALEAGRDLDAELHERRLAAWKSELAAEREAVARREERAREEAEFARIFG
jgi:hypothetical protein